MCLSLPRALGGAFSAVRWGPLAAVVIGILTPSLSADGQPSSATFEQRRLERALSQRGYSAEQAPEGKRIAFIDLAREEVFMADDGLRVPLVLPGFAPTWPNAFHWLTQERVIRRELLFTVGERYDATRVEESVRNLRALAIFALVRIVPVRGPDADTVGILVYTRDIWSLRLEASFSGTADAFHLSGQLTERNLFGRHKQLSARFGFGPKTFTLGEAYNDWRVLDEPLSLSQALSVIWNRDSGRTEGSAGSVSFGRPFYRLADRYSWTGSAAYSVYVARVLRGAEVSAVRYEPDRRLLVRCEAEEPSCLRQVWDSSSHTFSFSGTYRRGDTYKQRFSLGAGYSDASVEPNAETRLMPDQRDEFKSRVLPKVRRQVFPYLRYALALPRYATFENLSTFGQSETVGVGPAVSLYVAFPLRAFGSSSDSMRISGSSGYVLAECDALAQLALSAGARLEDGSVVDQGLSILLRGATPPWLLGRFAGRASLSAQRRDRSNSTVALGASNGLRGYPASAFAAIGGSLMRGSVEYRTLPLDVASIHLGGVLFYDTGTVYNSLSDIAFRNSVGAGLRVLFPQFNRYVFRADFGVPLQASGLAVELSFGTAQAFALTPGEDG